MSEKRKVLTGKPMSEWLEEAQQLPEIRPLFEPWWNEGETCFFFGSTGIGKTLYSMQMAYEISKTKKLVYFDFEMSERQLFRRYQKNGEPIQFPEKFFRVEIAKDKLVKPKEMIKEVVNEIEELEAEVVIIDNITWLLENTQEADASISFMKEIVRIKTTLDVSVLILAHTPKRKPTTTMAKGGSLNTFDNPLELADMAGSAALNNFIDSCFGIGKSRMCNKIRYLKHLKARSGEIVHGEDNVVVCRIGKNEEGLLMLIPEGTSSESEHLLKNSETLSRNEKIMELYRKGESQRKIGQMVGLSHTQVRRIIISNGETGENG